MQKHGVAVLGGCVFRSDHEESCERSIQMSGRHSSAACLLCLAACACAPAAFACVHAPAVQRAHTDAASALALCSACYPDNAQVSTLLLGQYM